MHGRCMCATNWIKEKNQITCKNVCWHLIVYDLNLNAFTRKKENKRRKTENKSKKKGK